MLRRLAALLAATLSLTPLALAQRHHDPLTDAEIDQLREAAQLPEQRLKLYVTFARERLDGVEKVQHDPKVTNHGDATHDQLQRFVDVYDELNDNVDTFAERRDDIRKVLQVIINADTEFQSKLRALQSSATARSAEAGTYEFLLSNAVDAVDQGAKDHKQTLQEQEEEAKHKKLIKPK